MTTSSLLARLALLGALLAAPLRAEPQGPFGLDLPADAVSDHYSVVRRLDAGKTETFATFDGPGCLKRLWLTTGRPPNTGYTVTPGREPRAQQNRKIIIRIYFDGATEPNVEAPLGDFFGMMHGVDYYPVNTPFVATKEHNGYECYFDMPFAKSARIEFANAPDAATSIYLQVAWHRYPDQELKEPRRFHAQWRREMPTERYGPDYLILDAEGAGQLVGFFYGVRLIDSVDRWSHGGAENIYIDGLGRHPAFLRGIGGEDTFATSYGGVLHRPETHLYDGIPYYTAEDTGEARSAQRLVGYRFYVHDSIRFERSLRFQFGCMENDICSMVYWYQSGPARRYVKLPAWEQLLPATELKRGAMDLPPRDDGSWRVGAVRDNAGDAALAAFLAGPGAAETETTLAPSLGGFVDFNHVHRPRTRGVGTHHKGKAAAATAVIDAPRAMTAKLRLAWDDRLALRVNDTVVDGGAHSHFRDRTFEVPLRAGPNRVTVLLGNESGSNHGGWTFAFLATTPEGAILTPRAEP